MNNREFQDNKENNGISDDKNSFIVGIGTSAGGLEALKIFFDNLPSDFNHAIVIVQHLSPDYKSLMADLLSRNTDLPLHEVEDGSVIEAGNVYLIPPKKNMTIKNGVLHLTDKPKGFDLNLPIDIFFKSLAVDQKEKSIGIVLSGTGSDGTRGMRAIKEFGGMLMVQKPTDAKFDGMPNSTIATGLVDYILPVAHISPELVNFIHHPKSLSTFEDDENSIFKKDFEKLISLVHKKTDIDFSDYKLPTLVRRVERRMQVNKAQTIRDYLHYVFENENELEILNKEFLIGVTKFFRDTEAFDFIKKKVIPKIFKNKGPKDRVKIWSVGCSSGEEAYSLAILLKEYMDENNLVFDVKIFATDLDKEVIHKANKGAFTQSIVADVSLELLKKYFIQKGDLYVISPEIRKMIIFSQHNVAQDPPLTKMDLITCRNLLIYVNSALQQKIIGTFHYALNPNRFLFLGPSESIGQFSSSLKVLSRKWRVYQNVAPTKTLDMGYYNNTFSSSEQFTIEVMSRQTLQDKVLNETLAESLLEEFGAASAFVDKDFDLISADGNFRNFFQFPKKRLRSFHILKILPQPIAIALSTALRKAEKENIKVIYKDIVVSDDRNDFETITLIVNPVKVTPTSVSNVYMVLFLAQSNLIDTESAKKNNTALVQEGFTLSEADKEKIVLLEQELMDTKANLQSMVKEIETSNEELQATNEELLSSNEELQSTNEELQSVNEELHTVNAEYQEKMVEIADINSDLENLIDSTEIGTIFLDKDLKIRKFTPTVKKIFNIIDSDIGRPISHFNSTFGDTEGKTFIETLYNVLNTGISFEKEILHRETKWYLKRLNPFLNSNQKIEGVVISFVNITELKKLESTLAEKNKFLEKVLEVTPNILYIFNQQTQSNEYANKDLFKQLGYSSLEIQAMGSDMLNKIMYPEDLPRLINHFDNIKNSKEGEILEVEYRVKHKDGSYRWLLSLDTVFEKIKGTDFVKHIGVAVDITQLKESQQKLKEVNENLEQEVSERTQQLEVTKQKYKRLYNNAPDMFVSVDPKNGEVLECNKTLLDKTGFTRKDVIGAQILDLYHKDSKDDAKKVFELFKKNGTVTNKELKINKKRGGYIEVNLNVSSIKDKDGNIMFSSSSWRDITDLKEVMSELEELTYASTHDMKAPINNISSFLSLLKEDKSIVDENSIEAIKWIERNIKNANDTLSNLISVAKARTQVLENLIDIDIEKSFDKTITGFKTIIDKSNISIKKDFTKCKTVLFSELHFNSMLQNILNNAIKYRSSERDLKIEIKSFEEDGFNCISIKDNGIGINLDEHRNHVFGLFKRATDKKEGSGLALYLIKKILDKTGGGIKLESKLGKGSTFTLCFKNNENND
ncbi:chemotaxis protein CheB [Polaribacter dokdonensis]|uniref:Two-component system sensor histidine kinase n=1 Tax=Polaribacter dokdonensis DSW-5 TaxID=1300348 RepID=A0A0M9CIE8_9FLAO|nr:chemotaxis protein CheB [Polaribacter dokdonensis]KOY53076.1 Two-component system sensor histidine kinase [Polaribacter dokdonensis DSW-5]SEE56845.1 two-component system, chemotaxis family, CheB/CheR fusion protein [Polaribacter dokdonensis DSW-5]